MKKVGDNSFIVLDVCLLLPTVSLSINKIYLTHLPLKKKMATNSSRPDYLIGKIWTLRLRTCLAEMK